MRRGYWLAFTALLLTTLFEKHVQAFAKQALNGDALAICYGTQRVAEVLAEVADDSLFADARLGATCLPRALEG